MMNEIENVSDQLFLFMGEINSAIQKLQKDNPELTYDQCLKLAEVAALDMRNDVLWKRLDAIKSELNGIRYNTL